MISAKVLLLILGLVCELLAAFGVPTNTRVSLMPLGLFFWMLAGVVAF